MPKLIPDNIAVDLWKKALADAPLCLIMMLVLAVVGWSWSTKTFADRDEFMAANAETRNTMNAQFTKLFGILELTELEGKVQELESAIQQAESDKADLEMVLASMGATAEGREILDQRVFSLTQEIASLNRSLDSAQVELREARQAQ